MTTTEIDFAPVQPGTSQGTLYTPPGSGDYAIITQIIMANTGVLSATLTIGKSGVAVADQIVPTVSIPAKTVETLDLAGLRITDGDTLEALQGTSGAITVTICGYEIT